MPSGVRYLALLRGINVGGKNLISMAALREAFETLGFESVQTYIQTGNVFFNAPRQKRQALADQLERALSERFGIELKVVLLTEAQMRAVVKDAPRGFGSDEHRCDVIFLRAPLTVAKARAVMELREGVDEVWTGTGVIYWARLDARASSSKISKFAVTPEYKNSTIRSWSTATKLARLMGAPT
jgi:uncharacterized protein (DUF1697 family)